MQIMKLYNKSGSINYDCSPVNRSNTSSKQRIIEKVVDCFYGAVPSFIGLI